MSVRSALTRLANALRILMGEEIPLTLDQMGDQAEDANRLISLQQSKIDALFNKVNNLPNKGDALMENCTLNVDLAGIYTFMAWSFVQGGREVRLSFTTNQTNGMSVKKDSLLTFYAPGSKGVSVAGGVELLEASGDGAAYAFEVTGPGSITMET